MTEQISSPISPTRGNVPNDLKIPLVCLAAALPLIVVDLLWTSGLLSAPVIPLLVIAAGYVIADRLVLRLSVGRHNLSYAAYEFALVAGALFVPPLVHLVVRFVSSAFGTWLRVHKNPRVPAVGAAFGNGSLGLLDVAVFTTVLRVVHITRELTVRNTLVWVAAWTVMFAVNQVAVGIGRRLSGERDFLSKIRKALTFLTAYSMTTLGVAVLMFSEVPSGIKLMVLVVIATGFLPMRPFVGMLVEADVYRLMDEFYSLLQTSDSSNVEAALRLAGDAVRCATLQLVIIEREGIDHALDSALIISTAGRDTVPVADLDAAWLDVLNDPRIVADQAAIICPLFVGGLPVGLFVCTERFETSRAASEEELATANRLAQHLSLWLEQDRLLNELRQGMATRTFQALHDPLTGLLNRRGLYEAWDAATTDDGCVAVFLIDLDGFKDVNSFVGHEGGDQLLVMAAQRLSAALPPRAQIARIGGDEFAAFIPSLRHGGKEVSAAGELGKQIRDFLDRTVTINGDTVKLAGSVGVAVSPHHGTDLKTLLSNADAALFNAKEDPDAGVAVFGDQLYGHETRAMDGYRLKAAIDNNEIEVHFQPVVNMSTYRVSGFEALVRWRDRDRLVPPAAFIGLAEKTGHIHALTERVMQEAFAQVVRWRELTGLDLHMGVNVSPLCVTHPDTLRALTNALQRSGMDPADVYLEVTESRMFRDPVRATLHLRNLRTAGVKISLDDFGTGASTHDWLVRMAPDCIKIDRSFVSAMGEDKRAVGIIEVDVLLGDKFGMGVIAEGVETSAQWNQLQSLGVTHAQGYLISRPKTAAQINEWLRNEEPELRQLITLAASLEPTRNTSA